jgi:hypothetical protein
MLELYGFWRSLATCRVRIALRLKGVAFEAVNPQAVVPALVIEKLQAFERSQPLRQPGAPAKVTH